MNADRARGAPDITQMQFHSVSSGIEWKTTARIFALALVCVLPGVACHALLVPGEARHVGIVHDMLAAQQYLMPRVNGLPVLDGAPLHYWLSLLFLSFLGVSEWIARLPSVLAAVITVTFLTRTWAVWLPPRSTGTLLLVFVLQPAIIVASRFASPDMLSLLLLTVSVNCFLVAAQYLEQGDRHPGWQVGAWVAAGWLGMSAGPLAALLPLVIGLAWLALRRRFDMLRAMCWWPGPVLLSLIMLPWLWLADLRYPGIVTAILARQLRALTGNWAFGWNETGGIAYVLVIAGSLLPLLLCLLRFVSPERRRLLRSPAAGLMAVWFFVLVPAHPLAATTMVGPAILLTLPLVYFGVLALVPLHRPLSKSDGGAWALHIAVIAAVGVAAAHFVMQRVTTLSPLTEAVSARYHATHDKVVLLDRFDYEFNFYMRSPKLVYVESDWNRDRNAPVPAWKADLYEAARFDPEAASRLLISPQELTEKLCERRVVNLWLIGSRRDAERHPILLEMNSIRGPGDTRAWYLDASTDLAACSPRSPND